MKNLGILVCSICVFSAPWEYVEEGGDGNGVGCIPTTHLLDAHHRLYLEDHHHDDPRLAFLGNPRCRTGVLGRELQLFVPEFDTCSIFQQSGNGTSPSIDNTLEAHHYYCKPLLPTLLWNTQPLTVCGISSPIPHIDAWSFVSTMIAIIGNVCHLFVCFLLPMEGLPTFLHHLKHTSNSSELDIQLHLHFLVCATSQWASQYRDPNFSTSTQMRREGALSPSDAPSWRSSFWLDFTKSFRWLSTVRSFEHWRFLYCTN